MRLTQRLPFALLFIALAGISGTSAVNNGLGLTPQMGFNSWNAFALNINETVFNESAMALNQTGLAALGYVYLNVDDGWSNKSGRVDGRLQPNMTKFPNGISGLANYAHSLGLKFGIYSDAGELTCGGYPASLGYEEIDAETFAEWGVDYLKYDNCYSPTPENDSIVIDRFTTMGDALNATGRPIFYSLCEWGLYQPWLWAPEVGNSWRTTNDITPTWEGMLRCLDNNNGLGMFAGKGGWNDPDMLEVGNPGLSLAESRAHFALWAAIKSPLLIGGNLFNLTSNPAAKPFLDILMAKEVIAVNQDPLGVPAEIVWKQGHNEIYAGPLVNNSRVAVFFNRQTNGNASDCCDWPNPPVPFQLPFSLIGFAPGTTASVRDLYLEQDLGNFTDFFVAAPATHDVVIVKITPLNLASANAAWRPWDQTSMAIYQNFPNTTYDATARRRMGRRLMSDE
jgi:alpha-galactosidase